MVDSQAEMRRLSFKDALLNKYSLDDQSDDEELCFIHIGGSPKHKGGRNYVMQDRQVEGRERAVEAWVNIYLMAHLARSQAKMRQTTFCRSFGR